jgi:hypothetical protein
MALINGKLIRYTNLPYPGVHVPGADQPQIEKIFKKIASEPDLEFTYFGENLCLRLTQAKS